MQPEARGQVLWTVPSFISSRKASLQTRTSEAVEDAQCLSCVTARAKHHQEGACGQTGDGTRIRGWREQVVQGRGYFGQRRLCQQVGVRSATRPILPSSVEGTSQGKKYWETIICSSAPKKADQFLLQRSLRKANSGFSSHRFHSANG